MLAAPRPDAPVFPGGGPRQNARFQSLSNSAGIKPRLLAEIGREQSSELKGLWKTCATNHDEHRPKSSVQMLGQSLGGITYHHDEHRAPLGFMAIVTLPQSTVFRALVRDSGSECLCSRGRFADPG